MAGWLVPVAAWLVLPLLSAGAGPQEGTGLRGNRGSPASWTGCFFAPRFHAGPPRSPLTHPPSRWPRPSLGKRHQIFPPLWGAENSQQPVKRLCIAPRARTSWYVTCLEPPWALLPLEPRVRPLVGHFGLASIGTERTPHRSAYIIG